VILSDQNKGIRRGGRMNLILIPEGIRFKRMKPGGLKTPEVPMR
jgi:hypothetical protein